MDYKLDNIAKHNLEQAPVTRELFLESDVANSNNNSNYSVVYIFTKQPQVCTRLANILSRVWESENNPEPYNLYYMELF